MEDNTAQAEHRKNCSSDSNVRVCDEGGGNGEGAVAGAMSLCSCKKKSHQKDSHHWQTTRYDGDMES